VNIKANIENKTGRILNQSCEVVMVGVIGTQFS